MKDQTDVAIEMLLNKAKSWKIAEVTGMPYAQVRALRKLLGQAERLKQRESLRLNSYRRLKSEYNKQAFHLMRGW